MRSKLYELPQSWDDAISTWVKWMTASGASMETLRVRRGIMRSIVKRLDAARPDQVSTDELVAMCSAQQQQWSTEHRRNVRTTLVVFYTWAVNIGLCVDNPAAGMPKVRVAPPRPRPATDQIWRDLLEAADPRERMMARLAGEAGLRRAEVFPGQIDGHISPNYCGKLLSRLMPEGWSAHKLRHRYASRGFAATGDLLAVQQALGHSSVATTQRYVQVSPQSVRAVSEAAA